MKIGRHARNFGLEGKIFQFSSETGSSDLKGAQCLKVWLTFMKVQRSQRNGGTENAKFEILLRLHLNKENSKESRRFSFSKGMRLNEK